MQHTGSILTVSGRDSDNLAKKNLRFQVISADNPNNRLDFEVPPELVIFETINLGSFPQGEYIIRVSTTDLADNETIVSRKIIYDADDKNAQIAIFNPLPGEVSTGPVNIVGNIIGSFLPDEVHLLINGTPLAVPAVDRYGYFYHTVEETDLPGDAVYRISAYYYSETGKLISSPVHNVYYSTYGPALIIDSHNDGDVITKRPWMTGRAWVSAEPLPEGEEETRESRRQRSDNAVKRILVSYDNGRSFKAAKGTGSDWKFRLETGELPLGPQPMVIKAEFLNGDQTVRRILLHVDTTPPRVAALSPPEDSRHRDEIMVFGTAGDNVEIADINIGLRPRNKFWYSVPPAIQGLYFDIKGLGATYFDVGMGLSLFDDNVRFQFQFGLAPEDGVSNPIAQGGRFPGNVFGIKLMANIFRMPFDFLFGPDWAFYSMNLAIGANFSLFTMDEKRTDVFMGAILGQIDLANVDLSFFNPKWTRFRNYALYLGPELWFTTTDVQGPNQTEFRMTVGVRVNVF
jgi:hypothetical protein